jgi:hypothetical protein
VNKRALTITLTLILATIVGISGIVVFFHVPITTQSYTPSDDLFPNPGRGFYVQFDTADLDRIDELADSRITLVLLAYDLVEFTDQPIAQTKLDELSRAFSQIRNHGLMVIFRAAYGFSSTAEYRDPTSLALIRSHITQIEPILRDNADLLLSVQAGFLGPWGEWHHSNLGSEDGVPDATVINDLLEALADAVPESVSIAVRRPRFIRAIDPQRIDVRRIAFHNDGLLASESDYGTYDAIGMSREDELIFMDERIQFGANGGEMPQLSAYTVPSTAYPEFQRLHVTYLNRRYNTSVLDDWATQTLFNENFLNLVEKHLGYRWHIAQTKLPTQFYAHQRVPVSITLTNTGFSAITFPVQAELVLSVDENIVAIIPFEQFNLMDLQPGSSMTLTQSITLKESYSTLRVGFRVVMLKSPSPSEAYRIHLANDLVEVDGVTLLATYHYQDDLFPLYEIQLP